MYFKSLSVRSFEWYGTFHLCSTRAKIHGNSQLATSSKACTHTRICIRTHAHSLLWQAVHTYTHTHADVHTHMHTYTHTHTKHTHDMTYIYIHTHDLYYIMHIVYVGKLSRLQPLVEICKITFAVVLFMTWYNICVHTYTCIHTRHIHTYTHIRTYTHIYIIIHKHHII